MKRRERGHVWTQERRKRHDERKTERITDKGERGLLNKSQWNGKLMGLRVDWEETVNMPHVRRVKEVEKKRVRGGGGGGK